MPTLFPPGPARGRREQSAEGLSSGASSTDLRTRAGHKGSSLRLASGGVAPRSEQQQRQQRGSGTEARNVGCRQKAMYLQDLSWKPLHDCHLPLVSLHVRSCLLHPSFNRDGTPKVGNFVLVKPSRKGKHPVQDLQHCLRPYKSRKPGSSPGRHEHSPSFSDMRRQTDAQTAATAPAAAKLKTGRRGPWQLHVAMP